MIPSPSAPKAAPSAAGAIASATPTRGLRTADRLDPAGRDATDPLGIVRALEPVDLDELVSTAGLLTRVDRKYLLTAPQAASALAVLPCGTRALEIGARRSFGYESVYLDTPDLASYLAAARRRRRRYKVRLRTYADSGEDWLEVKTRAARGRTVKDRLADPAPRSTEAGRFVADTLMRYGIGDVDVPGLRPRLTVSYDRSTLLLPDGCRATVDTGMRWADGPLSREAEGAVVLETKSAGGAGALDRALWRLGHRPARISKYGTGLALLHPGLPRGPWHRTLARLDAGSGLRR